jgi:hypothetical protein
MLSILADEDLIVLPDRGGATLEIATGTPRASRPELAKPSDEFVSGRWRIGDMLFVDPMWDSNEGDRQLSITRLIRKRNS